MHHRLLRGAVHLALSLTGVLLVAGCGTADGAPGLERQAVLGGEPTYDAHAGTLYVVSEIRNIGGQQISKIGSSALVAPNLLATALHVVSQNPSNVPFTCDASGDVVSGSSGALLGAPVAPEKIEVYSGPTPSGEPVARGMRVLSTGSTTICQNDLAFVILDRALDLPTYPLRRAAPVAVGASLTVVGYGSGLNTGFDTAERSQRAVSVTAVGQWVRTFTVSSGPCEGDSGGPALGPENDLLGIFSSVALDCTAANAAPKYTDLSYFAPLVERAFEQAGAGSPWAATGEGGAGGAGEAPTAEAGRSGGDGEAAGPREDPAASGCSVSRRNPPVSSSLALITLVGIGLYGGVRRRAPATSRQKLALLFRALKFRAPLPLDWGK